MWSHLLILACSGAVGCAARTAARDVLMRRRIPPWWAIVAINLLGAAVMGMVAGAASARAAAAAPTAAASTAERLVAEMAMGLLGGWTTYSAFAMDAVSLWLRGRRFVACAVWAVTVGGAPLAALVCMQTMAAAVGALLAHPTTTAGGGAGP